ncbi:MAG: hypothetical protein HY717_14460 [Planctomycetes bacterium]|nr:hypothetical protein [Planctomycetota bacterium]
MLEQLQCHAYRNFWEAVPAIARGLEESDEVRIFQFTGSATIGSHDAAFHSLLADRKSPRRLKILMLSPLSLHDMAERQRMSRHTPEQYIKRIFQTLEHLRWLREAGAIQVEARLYARDPLWYFWIFKDSVVLYSHALGVGRRSPRVELREPRGELRALFTGLFENAWSEPENRAVDFDGFDSDTRSLREEVDAALGRMRAGADVHRVPWTPSALPSPWNISCETHPHVIDLLPFLRNELENSSMVFYCGATGETRFGKKNADFAAAIGARGKKSRRIRILLIAPWSEMAVEEKVRASTSGRSAAETRDAIFATLRVLGELRREQALDLEVRLRRELGTIRLYAFDRSVCFASFINAGPKPSPWVLLRERGQEALVPFFRERFEDSWEEAGGNPRGIVDLVEVVAAPKRPAEPEDLRRSAIVFDAQRFLLTIDGEPQKLMRSTLFFLLALASERGAFLPMEQEIDGKPARRCRVDLGTAIGRETARRVIETVHGIGYRFQPWVRVINAGQPGLRTQGNLDT